MFAQKLLSKPEIDLKGSIQIVCEYFTFAISSILYIRSVYPDEYFIQKKHYDIPLNLIDEPNVKAYISHTVNGIQALMEQHKAKKLIVVLVDKESDETMERWSFNIDQDDGHEGVAPTKQSVQLDIRGIMRQIVSTSSFLPSFVSALSFRILIVTDDDTPIESKWMECDPHFIPNSETVDLKSFGTGSHKISTSVSYRVDDSTIL